MKILYNSFVNTLGLCLIALSSVIALSTCLGFTGEPDAPKSLLK